MSADHEDLFHVRWYGWEKEIICGHVETNESDDEYTKCHGSYNECGDWLCCPVYDQWYHEDCFL